MKFVKQVDITHLMHENIFVFFVIPTYETVAILNIEPLNGAGHSFRFN